MNPAIKWIFSNLLHLLGRKYEVSHALPGSLVEGTTLREDSDYNLSSFKVVYLALSLEVAQIIIARTPGQRSPIANYFRSRSFSLFFFYFFYSFLFQRTFAIIPVTNG
jgi:hypothetical protein